VDTQKIVFSRLSKKFLQTGFDSAPLRLGIFSRGNAHQKAFAAAGLAGDDFQGGFGAAQPFGQKLHEGLVGLAFHGRGVQFDLEGAVVLSDDGILRRFGLHPHVDQQALGMVVEAHVSVRIGFKDLRIQGVKGKTQNHYDFVAHQGGRTAGPPGLVNVVRFKPLDPWPLESSDPFSSICFPEYF
jgi:hypothetical protein